jgi:peptidoglycan/LPS O-acetylase OafA/YrhL
MAVQGPDRPHAAVPDVVAPPPRHPRFPLTVGLRGIPAVAILIGHAWLYTGGFGDSIESLPNRAMVRWDGLVAVFFLLSAFLLYRPMIAHRAGGPSAPRVGAYAKRRFLRLYPAYWVALTALAIVPGLFGVFGENWWAFYSLTDYLDFGLRDVCPPDQGALCGLPQSWTLGVDMTFYVALPFYAALAALVARGRNPRKWMMLELALLAVLAALSLILGGAPFSLREESWFRFSFLGHFYWFAVGLALAVLSVVYGHSGYARLPSVLGAVASRPAASWAGAFGIYVFTVFVFGSGTFILADYGSNAEYIALNLIQGVGAALLFIPAAFGNPNRGVAARVLGHPVLMWFGLVSYGILLWHVTIVVDLGVAGAGFWTVLVLGSVLAIPLAAASYYLVERPLMKFKFKPLRDALPSGLRRTRDPAPDAGRSG